jgi:hypothetical protein
MTFQALTLASPGKLTAAGVLAFDVQRCITLLENCVTFAERRRRVVTYV